MIVVTTEQIEGKRITETLGLVRGSTIRARNVGHDIMASLRNIVGGEVKDYTVMLAQARDCLLYTSPSPRDRTRSRMPSSA